MARPLIVTGPDRFPRLDPTSFSAAQQMAAAALAASPRGEVRGPFIPLLRSPELLDRAQALGEYLRYRCSVPERLREFAILVVAIHWRQPYEWHAHVLPALSAGVASATLEALAEGRSLGDARDDERLIKSFVDELLLTHAVGDATYAMTLALLGEQGVIDLLGLCGYYSMLAMVLNVARTKSPDPGFCVPA